MVEAKRLQEKTIDEQKLLEVFGLEKKIEDKKSMDKSVRKEKIVITEERKLPGLDFTKSSPGSRTKPVSKGASKAVKSTEEMKTEKGIIEKIRRRKITSEEKKLMVKVGVAALVIFSLGAYVSYSF
ncbi:hypothetical protein Bca52824_069666 [Brassica carinata]|uniref:Uncharacterized protein n=1 Tax=Brassica carinata TaxID=52824 RepID=A0A8X7Q4Q8_BRACI|nr:hypothetical protein Bca52824_069666 [Brassica carinata]